MKILALASAIAIGLAAPALADTYTQANFSANVSPGNANVQPPFTAVVSQGETLNGSFVYDDNLVPGGGSGFVNVYPSSFPDTIPAGNLFSFALGSIALTAANADPGAPFGIQYNNGAFNGFVGGLDFTYNGSSYQLDLSGGSFGVYALVNGNADLSTDYVSGTINIGNSNLSGQTGFTPPPPPSTTPEPASWALMLIGVGAMGVALRTRRRLPAA